MPAFATTVPTVHAEGQTELMANYAGQGVGLIHEILSAAEIVGQMVSGAETMIRRMHQSLTRRILSGVQGLLLTTPPSLLLPADQLIE